MNESYLFRGKRLDNKEWAEGSLVDKTKWHGCYEIVVCNDAKAEESYTAYEVDPSTIGRCAGFKDLNGILVFEGDRLSDGKREYIVIYSDSSTGMAAVATDKSGTYSLYHLVVQYKKAWVIGTIHDRRPNE